MPPTFSYLPLPDGFLMLGQGLWGGMGHVSLSWYGRGRNLVSLRICIENASEVSDGSSAVQSHGWKDGAL